MKVSKYKLESYFEKNIGQFPNHIKYKSKANGYTTYFTSDELIISLPSNIENKKNLFKMKLENKNSDANIEAQNKKKGIVNYFSGSDKSKWINNIPTYSKIKYEEVYENIDLYYYINDNNLEYDFVLYKGANPRDIAISFDGIDNIEIDNEDNVKLTVGDVKAILLKPTVYQIIDNKKMYIDCEYRLDKDGIINFLIDEYDKEYELVLDPVLKLDYSTFLGGDVEDFGVGIAIDRDGYIYVLGISGGNFPITDGAYQTNKSLGEDVFVSKLNSNGTELIYSTYLGGSTDDWPAGIAVDTNGCAYVTGYTYGGFPTTEGAIQETFGGGSKDAFVSKLSKDGSKLIYSTYLGGSGDESVGGIAVDTKGCAYITGGTNSTDYPITEGVYQPRLSGKHDVFVSKLDIDNNKLVYSTYIGGTGDEYSKGIAIDRKGCAYITGFTTSTDYPTTLGAYQTTNSGETDIIITKLNTNGTKLIYSTYIGGYLSDGGSSIVVDDKGYAYITGGTSSPDFPITTHNKRRFGEEAILCKLNIDGSSLIYSRCIGGDGDDSGISIAVDDEGCAYIVGQTTGKFPITEDTYQENFAGGQYDIFVSKISEDGKTYVYSTYIGSVGDDYGSSIAVDRLKNAYIVGYTTGNYPTTESAYQPTFGGIYDVVVSKISSIEIDITWSYRFNTVKLLDCIDVNFIINNLSTTNVDINIKFQYIDNSLTFMENSLCIQGIYQSSSEIPSQLYIENIQAKESATIDFGLKYTDEKFSQSIPISVEVEVYYNKMDTPTLVESIEKTFYIDTKIGPNYIPGCNAFYNLVINGKLSVTSSGIPILYYKTGSSYIYLEPYGSKYVYKVLSNPTEVTEISILS